MTNQFWKGLLMAVVSVLVAAFSTTPLVLSVVIVTLIGTILVYFGTNTIIPLRPISIPTTLSGRDVIHALLILVGNAIIDSVAMIVIEGRINLLVLGKIVLSITFTYLGTTLFAGPYSTRKVSWGRMARLEYNRVRR